MVRYTRGSEASPRRDDQKSKGPADERQYGQAQVETSAVIVMQVKHAEAGADEQGHRPDREQPTQRVRRHHLHPKLVRSAETVPDSVRPGPRC